MTTLKIGIVGFSRNSFNQVAARTILREAFAILAQKHGDGKTIEIVSGYTAMGVPKIAYELAEVFGFTKVGFSAKQAFRTRSGLYPVDKEIIVGERFGDESEAFVTYIDGLIRVGGGPQSRHEVALFKERYAHLPLARILREYEVDWYGPAPKAAPSSTTPTLFTTDSVKENIVLDDRHDITVYRNVREFQLPPAAFQRLWDSHPPEYHEVMMHGKLIKTPRWQQAYGKNYEYTGSKNNALPLAVDHQMYLDWCHQQVDERINGLLINWYAGDLQHYIGKHRDSTKGLQADSPIVTISHGGERAFRFRPFRGNGYRDFPVKNGDVIVIPAATNKAYTHEVPFLKKYNQDRISVTLRAYV